MTRAYVQAELRRRIPVVNDTLAEPKSVDELRCVLRRRARRENNHDGRSDLSDAEIIRALAAVKDGRTHNKDVGRTENFLGGTGLVLIRGLKITLTAAGLSLLADAQRHRGLP